MYCNKENVNILTALLVKHFVRHVVVCPGSRNAPIVHNLNECPDITCYPVTDERSAGFYALGLALGAGAPRAVGVCVTSGTALLNLLPAVAEAYYQQVPLVVISADRPPQWIDQQDGQTLPQPDALGRFVRKAVSLPEPRDDEERWYCNRLVNEALLSVRHHGLGPVHINVPISEPLFEFAAEALPDERKIVRRFDCGEAGDVDEIMIRHFMEAKRPMIVIGQTHSDMIYDEEWRSLMTFLAARSVVLYEPLCNYFLASVHFEEVLSHVGNDEAYMPDVVLHLGGTIVSKRLKKFLRAAKHAKVYYLDAEGRVCDVFMHLTEVVECLPAQTLWNIRYEYEKMLAGQTEGAAFHPGVEAQSFCSLWRQQLEKAASVHQSFVPAYSQMAAVKYFEEQLSLRPYKAAVHYANSSAIRLACIYARHAVFCNRGVNGIEGSLSTAAGMSLATDEPVFCVIGDLSFFYDQNALWNQNLKGNFRILLLNNGKGGIFNMLKGLEQSPARDRFVAAEHHTTAAGICQQNGVAYRQATDLLTMQQGIDWLLTAESEHPLLLEVLTDDVADERVYRDYYHSLSI